MLHRLWIYADTTGIRKTSAHALCSVSSIRTLTVGFGISPNQRFYHLIKTLADYTAGEDFRLALKQIAVYLINQLNDILYAAFQTNLPDLSGSEDGKLFLRFILVLAYVKFEQLAAVGAGD